MIEVRSAELSAMSEAEREATYTRLAEALDTPNPEFEADVSRRIREFEIRYEVPSRRMLEELRAGQRKETAEIAEWLFWLRVRTNESGET
jgi:hypothetical protein